jgi:hypothetical protein
MKTKHSVHKYARVFLDKDIRKSLKPRDREIVYRCFLPNCTHYLRRQFTLGRKSICWFCEKEFLMGLREIDMKHPNCGCRTKLGKMREQVEAEGPLDLQDILKLI